MRRCLLLFVALLITTGCLKRAEPKKAAEPLAVAAVFLLDQEYETEVLEAPATLIDSSTALLAERNLVVRTLPAGEWATDFANRRSTRQRMLSLLERSKEDIVLLVETRARLASLIEGRYTWTVPVQITLARRDNTDFPVQASMEVPVFLRFAHQDADDAVMDATRVIAKKLARMSEELLSDEDLQTQGRRRDQTPGTTRTAQVDGAGSSVTKTLEGADGIYFVMVDRHRNGDPSNDADADPADPQAFHGGDLRGLIDDLDRIAGLGFRSVWLTPVWDTRDERIGEWGAFHGYWVEDPGAVEPRFGTEAELVELSAELRRRDMGLIVDFVANHVAPGTALLEDKPSWFHRNGDIEDWNDREEAITHDVHGLPDLAQENPEVADWLVGHALSWKERLRPEGFRLDAVRHVDPVFWSQLNKALGEDVLTVGEFFDGSPEAVASWWDEGTFSGMFDFPLHYALTDVFCEDAPVGRLAAMLSRDRVYPDASRLVTFLDNHDLPRLASRCSREDMAGALSALLALRGRPSISWGTELPLNGAEEPGNRADFDWDAERRFEKQIALGLRMRAQHPALRASTRQFVQLDDDVVAWVQSDGEGVAFVVVNRGDDAATAELPELVEDWTDPTVRRALDGVLDVPAGSVGIAVSNGAGDQRMAEWVNLARSEEKVAITVRLKGASLAEFDEVLLVGASEELGGWNPDTAVPTTRDGQDFVATVEVPSGDVLEFKFVTRQDGGGVVWEDRPNRYHLVRGKDEVTARWEA